MYPHFKIPRSLASWQFANFTCIMANAQAHCFGNVHKVKIFITIKQRLFNKGLRRTENFEVVCSLQQVSQSEYINKDIWVLGYALMCKIFGRLQKNDFNMEKYCPRPTSIYQTQVNLGSDLWVRMSLPPTACWDSKLTGNANRAIKGNVATHVTQPGGQLWNPC